MVEPPVRQPHIYSPQRGGAHRFNIVLGAADPPSCRFNVGSARRYSCPPRREPQRTLITHPLAARGRGHERAFGICFNIVLDAADPPSACSRFIGRARRCLCATLSRQYFAIGTSDSLTQVVDLNQAHPNSIISSSEHCSVRTGRQIGNDARFEIV